MAQEIKVTLSSGKEKFLDHSIIVNGYVFCKRPNGCFLPAFDTDLLNKFSLLSEAKDFCKSPRSDFYIPDNLKKCAISEDQCKVRKIRYISNAQAIYESQHTCYRCGKDFRFCNCEQIR